MLYPTLWRSTPSPLADDLFSAGRVFDRFFDRTPFQAFESANRNWLPPVDVCETADDYRLLVEVPGMNPDDIEVVAQNDLLTVRGEKRFDLQEGVEQENYTMRERRYGRFERSFRLPDGIDTEKLSAHYENGILTLTLPKAETARARRIEISSGQEAVRIGSGSEK